MGLRIIGTVVGAFVFRLVYTIALRFNMPAYMLKLVSSVIVIFAIAGPYLKSRYPEFARRLEKKKC
jgi:putative ABC transport system permease protein